MNSSGIIRKIDTTIGVSVPVAINPALFIAKVMEVGKVGKFTLNIAAANAMSIETIASDTTARAVFMFTMTDVVESFPAK